MTINRLDQQLAITSQIRPDELAGIKAAGYRAIINNRPDGEEAGQPSSDEIEAAAKTLGLPYSHIPIAPGQMTDGDALSFARALDEAGGPVLAFCRSGNRSAAVWERSRQLRAHPTDAQG